jgi:hypothetical protein
VGIRQQLLDLVARSSLPRFMGNTFGYVVVDCWGGSLPNCALSTSPFGARARRVACLMWVGAP